MAETRVFVYLAGMCVVLATSYERDAEEMERSHSSDVFKSQSSSELGSSNADQSC